MMNILKKYDFNKFKDIDAIILLLLLFEITIFSLLNIRGLGNRLILLLLLLRLFVLSPCKKFKKRILISYLLIFIVYSLSALLSDKFIPYSYYMNYKALLYTLTPLIYIVWLRIYRKSFFFSTFENLFIFFNVFYIINLIVMCIQGQFHGFLSGFSNYENTFTPDLMSGLFGYEGTAQFGLYSIFVLIYDMYMLKYSKYKIENKYIRYIIDFILFISIVISSSMNDNKANYISLILVLFEFFMIEMGGKTEKERELTSKFIYAAFGIIVVFGIFLTFSDLSFLEKISPQLKGTVYLFRKAIFDPTSYQSGEIGSIERVYIPLYVLYHPQYILFGAGTAFSNWQTAGTLGFPHFGQSDLSSFFALGGIFFCIIVFSIYNYFYLQIVGKVKDKVIFKISHFFVVFFYFFYTQPWTQSTLSICLLMLFIPLSMLAKRVHSEECA